MFKFFCCFIFLVQLTACSVANVKLNNQVKTHVEVEFSSPKHIRFQGKGAGVGMALMSTMGPVGVAIGVAIDEGIAKDIRIATAENGLVIDELIKNNLSSLSTLEFNINTTQSSTSQTVAEQAVTKSTYTLSILIKDYGFVIVDGNNDLTTAKWQLQVINDGGENKAPQKITEFNFPDDYKKQPQNELISFPLEQVKKEGKTGILLLNEGLQTIIADPYFKQALAIN